MENYVISCCSTVDLTQEHLKERNIEYVSFHFFLDGKEYLDDLGKSMSSKDFYDAMAEGADTKTAQVNVEEFINHFRPFLEQGKDIIHICLSSGLSGTFNSANLAKKELEESFPERKIYIVDSLGASSGSGLFVDKLADLRDSAMSIEDLYNWAEAHKLELNHWFFSTTLVYFVRGGRVSKAAGMIGNLLSICPLLNVDNLGRLIPRSKIRTKKKVIEEIVKKMEDNAFDGLDYSDKCFISHADCYEDAKATAQMIEEKFKKLNGKVQIYDIGTTIGSHTGPGTVALFFWGKERVD